MTADQGDLLLDFYEACVRLAAAWEQQEAYERDHGSSEAEEGPEETVFTAAANALREAYKLGLDEGISDERLDDMMLEHLPAGALKHIKA